MTGGAIFVPVYRYGECYALSIVDAVDADRVTGRRWYWEPGGYAQCWHANPDRTQALHRFILGLDRYDAGVVHHVNGDKLDNRRANLLVFPDESSHQRHHAALRAREIAAEVAA